MKLFPNFFIPFADAGAGTTERIQELQDRLLEINERTTVIQATADAEKRVLSEDETREMDQLFSEFDAVQEDIGRRQLIDANNKKMLVSAGRQTEPQHPEPQNRTDDDPPRFRARATRTPITPAQEDRGKWGWKGLGEFAWAVKNAAGKGAVADPRLVMNAPTTVSTEGVGADGGFLVPPDFRTTIWQKVSGEESLLGMTDQQTTSKNTMVFPADETTPWDTTGGVQAYFESEVGQLNQSKVALKDKTIRLNKLTALIPVSEELLEDAPGLDSYLRKKVGEKFDFKLNLKFLQGSGAGEPLGILNAASLVTVDKEGGQDADTIVAENIEKMYSRMYAPCRRNAVWLINQDIEPQLNSLNQTIGTAGVPVFLPPGGLSAAPYGTLRGRPIIPTQACETLGDKGDIIFADMSQYLTAVKAGNIRADVSMHLWFDYDTLAYRFIIRIAGQPWWATYITPRDSSNYLSWAVTLAERA
jgi:HK97 family phage major capsid protein